MFILQLLQSSVCVQNCQTKLLGIENSVCMNMYETGWMRFAVEKDLECTISVPVQFPINSRTLMVGEELQVSTKTLFSEQLWKHVMETKQTFDVCFKMTF